MTITPDQITELEEVQERLVAVLLREADPSSWVRDVDAKTTKQRLDQKRNAAATLTIVTKISSVLNYMRSGGMVAPPDDPEEAGPVKDHTADEILGARKEAHRILAKANGGS